VGMADSVSEHRRLAADFTHLRHVDSSNKPKGVDSTPWGQPSILDLTQLR